MPQIQFGTRGEANDFRDRVSEYLTAGDDRRSKTIRLKGSAPDRIVERARETAMVSQRPDSQGAGMSELSAGERGSLQRQHRTFDWQTHGFEAMRVKAALEKKGVTEWQDYYSPGEGVPSAIQKLTSSKERAAKTGATIGVGADYTDEEETSGQRRRQKSAERARGADTSRAKRPALVGMDADAREFLREEQRFNDSVWDISFSGSDEWGRPTPSGGDYELLEERNQQRSSKARQLDNVRAAPKTRDPLKWSSAPAQYDFPGLDTIDPAAVQADRSDRAREMDSAKDAELAPRNSPRVVNWAANPGRYDLPGVDTDASDGVIDERDTTAPAGGLFGGGGGNAGVDGGLFGFTHGFGGGKQGSGGSQMDFSDIFGFGGGGGGSKKKDRSDAPMGGLFGGGDW